MAGGFRISESGDSRVSELGDSRITEELIFASCSLSTTAGGLILTEAGDTRVSEDGTFRASENYEANLADFTGSLVLEGAISLSGGGGAITAGEVAQIQFADLTATGTMSASANASVVSSFDKTSTGSIASESNVILKGAIAVQASSSVGSTYSFVHGGLFTADPEDEYQRETEAGDIRIAENGDVRIVADILPNAAEGVLQSTYSYIAFNSTAYINQDGVWKTFTPNVKQDGTWDDPLAIYKKIDSQNWKRAY